MNILVTRHLITVGAVAMLMASCAPRSADTFMAVSDPTEPDGQARSIIEQSRLKGPDAGGYRPEQSVAAVQGSATPLTVDFWVWTSMGRTAGAARRKARIKAVERFIQTRILLAEVPHDGLRKLERKAVGEGTFVADMAKLDWWWPLDTAEGRVPAGAGGSVHPAPNRLWRVRVAGELLRSYFETASWPANRDGLSRHLRLAKALTVARVSGEGEAKADVSTAGENPPPLPETPAMPTSPPSLKGGAASPSPEPEANEPKSRPDQVAVTVVGSGPDRAAALESALANAARKAYGAQVYTRTVTEGAEVEQALTEVVSRGFVKDHKILEDRSQGGVTRLLVRATASLEGVEELFGPAKPLAWEPQEANWEELAAFQRKKRRFQAILEAMVGDPREVVERGYIIQKLGVEPTDVDVDRVQGEVRLWVSPNPGFWANYQRLLDKGESLARSEEAFVGGLLGRIRPEGAPACHQRHPCDRLGFAQPVQVPADFAPSLAKPLVVQVALGGGQTGQVTLWKNAVARGGLMALPDFEIPVPESPHTSLERTHRFRSGCLALARPFILGQNRGNSWPDQLQKAARRFQPRVPMEADSAADSAFLAPGEEDQWVRIFNGGVILRFQVEAPNVSRFQALASDPVRVTVAHNRKKE